MSGYTDEQKLEAVKAYRKGTGGLLATAVAQGVHVGLLRKWVAGYGTLGAVGVVTKKRRNHDLEFKLEVLRRVSDEGISCRQAAALFDIRRRDQAPPDDDPGVAGLLLEGVRRVQGADAIVPSVALAGFRSSFP